MRLRASTFVGLLGTALLAVVALPAPSFASTISLLSAGYLQNVSFENGIQANGCPVSWTCTINNGSAEWSANTPTSTQYPAPNGLSAGLNTPDGSKAAVTPIIGSASTLTQSLVGQSWVAGNDYTLEFWLGNPTGSPVGSVFPNTINIYFLAGATSPSSMCDSGTGRFATLASAGMTTKQTPSGNSPCQFTLSEAAGEMPADTDWRKYTFTFHMVGSVSGDIGVQFVTNDTLSAGNGNLMNLDMVAPSVTQQQAVPEPATLLLLGSGLLGVTTLARRRRKASK